MKEIYMLWVAGKGRPTWIYETREAVDEGIAYLKGKGVTREIYIFKSVEVIEGRKLLKLKKIPEYSKVEKKPKV